MTHNRGIHISLQNTSTKKCAENQEKHSAVSRGPNCHSSGCCLSASFLSEGSTPATQQPECRRKEKSLRKYPSRKQHHTPDSVSERKHGKQRSRTEAAPQKKKAYRSTSRSRRCREHKKSCWEKPLPQTVEHKPLPVDFKGADPFQTLMIQKRGIVNQPLLSNKNKSNADQKPRQKNHCCASAESGRNPYP